MKSLIGLLIRCKPNKRVVKLRTAKALARIRIELHDDNSLLSARREVSFMGLSRTEVWASSVAHRVRCSVHWPVSLAGPCNNGRRNWSFRSSHWSSNWLLVIATRNSLPIHNIQYYISTTIVVAVMYRGARSSIRETGQWRARDESSMRILT